MIPTADASIRDAKVSLLDAAPHPRGRLAGTGPVFVLKDTGQEGLFEARYRLGRFKVNIAERSFTLENVTYPAGTSCLDGPLDPRSVVLQWGAPDSEPFVVSGQVWGEDNVIGRPAILDAPVGRGHVVAWNAIINWQAIVADQTAAAGTH